MVVNAHDGVCEKAACFDDDFQSGYWFLEVIKIGIWSWRITNWLEREELIESQLGLWPWLEEK